MSPSGTAGRQDRSGGRSGRRGAPAPTPGSPAPVPSAHARPPGGRSPDGGGAAGHPLAQGPFSLPCKSPSHSKSGLGLRRGGRACGLAPAGPALRTWSLPPGQGPGAPRCARSRQRATSGARLSGREPGGAPGRCPRGPRKCETLTLPRSQARPAEVYPGTGTLRHS